MIREILVTIFFGITLIGAAFAMGIYLTMPYVALDARTGECVAAYHHGEDISCEEGTRGRYHSYYVAPR